MKKSDFLFCQGAVPFLDSSLINQERLKTIKQFYFQLPKELLTHLLVFESNLSRKIPQLDVSVSHFFSQKSRALFIDLIQDISWENLCHFFALSTLPVLWMEFDIHNDQFVKVPNFFVSTDHHDQFLDEEFCNSLMCIVMQEPKTNEKRKMMFACYEACKKRGYEFWTCGFMLARETKNIRMVIRLSVSQIDTIPYFLKEIGYEGDPSELIFLLQKLKPYLSNVCLSLDVEEKIGKRIGVECYSLFSQKTTWEEIFAIVSQFLVIEPQKSKASIEWCGNTILKKKKDSVSIEMSQRIINHIKFLFVPPNPIETKVYLAVRQLDFSAYSLTPLV